MTKRSVWKHAHKFKVNRTVQFEGSDVPSQIEGLLNLDKTKPEAEGSSSLKHPSPACGPKSSTLLTFKVGTSAVWVLQGARGSLRPAYNPAFCASKHNMPVTTIKLTFCGGEILSRVSYRLAGSRMTSVANSRDQPARRATVLWYIPRVLWRLDSFVFWFFFYIELRISRCMVV